MEICKKCPYNRFAKIPPTPIKKCEVAIIGEAPGQKEIAYRKPFVGPSGELLRKTLAIAKLPSMEEIFITNALLCRPSDKSIKKEAILNCQGRLIEEITAVSPKLILAFGNTAVNSITNDFSLKITQVQGKVLYWHLNPDIKIIPVYHPAAVLRASGRYSTFRDTMIYAHNVLYYNQVKNPGITEYIELQKDKEIKDAVNFLLTQKSVITGNDIETEGLKPYGTPIMYYGNAYQKNKVFIFPASKLSLLKELFESNDLSFGWQGGQFDTAFLCRENLPARIDHDSMILHYCLNENEGFHDLDTLSMRYLGADNYSEEVNKYKDKQYGMKFVPKEILLPYLAKDCDYNKQLIDMFLPIVEADPLLKGLYYIILIPGANFLRRVQWNGFHVNKDYCIQYRAKLKKQINDLNKKMADHFKSLWDMDEYKKQTGAKTAPTIFNPNSTKQLGWMIYKKLRLEPLIHKKTNDGMCVDAEVMETLIGQHLTIDMLLEHRKLQKVLSTYVDGTLKHLDEDNRIRSQFWLTRTVTGRLASRKPDLQNIKRDNNVKNIFGAPDGKILIEADYKTIELRVLAHVSGDKFFIKTFQEGKDPHDAMSIVIFGKDFTKEQRVKVKGVNFGIAYGRTAYSIAKEFDIPEWEAQELVDEWFDRAREAKVYMDNCEEYLEEGRVFITPFGRKRRYGVINKDDRKSLEHLKREARNFAIQSIASDLTLLAAMAIEPKLQKYNAMIVNLVHDSIIIEAPNDKKLVMELLNTMKEIMERIPQEKLHPVIPFPAEFSIGKSWGDMKEIYF